MHQTTTLEVLQQQYLDCIDLGSGNIADCGDVKCEAVSLETLKQSRDYTKLCKQHMKEHALLKKRHQKEKIITQKAYSSKNTAVATDSANRKSFKRKG